MQQPQKNRTFRTIALAVVLSLLALTSNVVRAPQAEALSSFDNEVLQLINNHRARLGLTRLVENPTMSSGAMSWSQTMNSRSAKPCGSQGFGHDPNSRYAENVAYSCGPTTFALAPGWTYSRMPAECQGNLVLPTALFTFCQWIDSTSHRNAIENAGFRQIGLGTSVTDTGSTRAVYSTNRFTTAAPATPPAPVPAPNGPLCGGFEVTVNMQTGQGRVTNGRDVILGTNEKDIINGLGGNDVICGLLGTDALYGGSGDDIIYGDGGSDNIYGQLGNDTLYGGSGADHIRGDEGNDRIWGNGGQDSIWGGDGNDDVQGNWESDRIWGGNGHDILRGAGGKDKLYGEAGNDQLYGGLNTDYLNGGSGSDTADGQVGRDNPLRPGVSGCEQAEVRTSC